MAEQFGGTLAEFVDLGMSPLCESFLARDELNRMEPFYPLNVRVCGGCFLAQVEEYVKPEHIFREYAYFSSYAQSWVEHARRYAAMAVERFSLGRASRIVELGEFACERSEGAAAAAFAFCLGRDHRVAPAPNVVPRRE